MENICLLYKALGLILSTIKQTTHTEGETDRYTHREGETDRQTYTHTEGDTDRHTHTKRQRFD